VSVFAHLDGLGNELEYAVADAILAWRKNYPKYRGAVDVIAEHVKVVKFQVSLHPGGVAYATVSIEARNAFDSGSEVFRFKRVGSGEWMRSAQSIPGR
jgi:hypothetical protein